MVWCVGKVERFGPKTKFEPFRKAKLAVQTRIHVNESRAAQAVLPARAEAARGRRGEIGLVVLLINVAQFLGRN